MKAVDTAVVAKMYTDAIAGRVRNPRFLIAESLSCHLRTVDRALARARKQGLIERWSKSPITKWGTEPTQPYIAYSSDLHVCVTEEMRAAIEVFAEQEGVELSVAVRLLLNSALEGATDVQP